MNTETGIVTAEAAGEHVLVVDDSGAQRRLLARTLSRWGYSVLEAESGGEALEICGARAVNLVISDWMMPGMSGVEFCRSYRELSQGKPGYFILLTAQTETEVLAEGLESGADDFLSKPVSPVELRARLRAGERVVNAQRDLAAKNTEVSQALRELSDAYSAIDRDLREARRFQEALVPERHVPFGPLDVSLLFRPSGHVGGDMVGYFPVREGELGVYSVDVSGHGVSSALMTARIASYFSATAPDRNIALRRTADGYVMLPPQDVCENLNALLQDRRDTDQYLTMVLAHVMIQTGEVSMCVAGHPSPILWRRDERPEFLHAFGMPLGLVENAELGICKVTLEKGDRLLIYSDGITECPDPKSVLLDEQGLAGLLEQHASHAGPELLARLVSSLEDYAGKAEFPDDLSAALIERL